MRHLWSSGPPNYDVRSNDTLQHPAAQFVDEAAAECAGRTPSTYSLSLQRCAHVRSVVPPPSQRSTHVLGPLPVALIFWAASIRW